jgi:hypothetical protein
MKFRFDEKMLSRLWDFVTERQEIRYRRYVRPQKPPWTDDPVLSSNHFTNIYREDDPGTIYCVEKLVKMKRPFSIAVWNILWYRMFGKEDTWEEFGENHVLPESTINAVVKMEDVMRRMVEEGRSPFTNAYLISNYGRSEDKVTVMMDVMTQATKIWPTTCDALVRAAQVGGDEGRQEAHAVLMSIHGIGKFIAFQTLVDLCYPVLEIQGVKGKSRLPFSNDGWATCGPGAERGINHCIPGIKPAEWNAGLKELCARAEDALSVRGFMFRDPGDGSEQMVDRANMCNCLCEFDKYVRLSAGEGKGRRRPFDPVHSYKVDREKRGHGQQFSMFMAT